MELVLDSWGQGWQSRLGPVASVGGRVANGRRSGKEGARRRPQVREHRAHEERRQSLYSGDLRSAGSRENLGWKSHHSPAWEREKGNRGQAADRDWTL